MVAVYAVTIFLSAALLFAVQPMVAKMLVPMMGGSTSVWTTSMLFFQATLLAGYGYAHLGGKILGVRRQVALHIPLMVIACVVLPLGVARVPDAPQWPALWVLGTLALTVGLPFFILSASSPMLQNWFAHTGHKDSADPYWLYGASNFGSMLALLSYPFLIEPNVGLSFQSLVWSGGYVFLILWTGGCGYFLYKAGQNPLPAAPAPQKPVVVEPPEAGLETDLIAAGLKKPEAVSSQELPVTPFRRAKWVLWAFVPSSLMLGATEYITTDVSSVPLFWVVPLALYLMTFIIVFSQKVPHLHETFRSIVMMLILAGLALTYQEDIFSRLPIWNKIPVTFSVMLMHIGLFFIVALFFHDQFARDRPHTRHLTEYFVWLSVGGALGGLFNALIAPVVFSRLVEYFAVLVLAMMVIPVESPENRPMANQRWAMPMVSALTILIFLHLMEFVDIRDIEWPFLLMTIASAVFVFLVALLAPKFEHVAIGIVAAGALGYAHHEPWVLHHERSFYAAYSIYDRDTAKGPVRILAHGTTAHGSQHMSDEYRHIPISYYYYSGGAGQVIEHIPHTRVGVVGLGAGALAAYASPGTEFVFFEIDPKMERVARRYFHYLEDCGDLCKVEIGDGRLLLEQWDGEPFDIIIFDAYSSDSIPTHLLTREAMKIYLERLTETGVLLFHVSNRYLDIESIVGALAYEADLISLTHTHWPDVDERALRVDGSRYVLVARDFDHLHEIGESEDWMGSYIADTVWTDDFTNIWSVFSW